MHKFIWEDHIIENEEVGAKKQILSGFSFCL